MLEKEVLRISKKEYYIDRDFDLLKDIHIQILKYLVNNLDIEFKIVEKEQNLPTSICTFNSKILKKEISNKISSSLNDKEITIDEILFIIKFLLQDIQLSILDEKRFGIIPITELPYKYLRKILSQNV